MKHILLKFHLALFAPLLIAGSLSAQCTAITPSASNGTINCGGTATLTATGSAGYQWWDQPSGGTLLGSTATYTTPSLVGNSTYYVEGTDTSPQDLMGLPAHNSPFGGNVRGYYFTAPVDFTITGLKIPSEVSGLQNITVVRLAALPPLYSTVTNAFTQLFITQNDPATGIIPVNIQVMAGDIIGILGQAGTNNSYSASATSFATTIAGQPVSLARLGMQYPLNTNLPHDLWTEASGSISRVEMYYTTSCVSPRVQVDVTVDPIIVGATAVNPSVCDGSGTTLDATGATTYNWMPGNMSGASVIVNPSATTTYTVTGDDPNGCMNTSTVTVTVNSLPTISASGSSSNICLGSTDTLSASGGITYAWSSGGTASTELVSPSSMMTYTVVGTDANGCSDSASVMVMVDPLPNVGATSVMGTICDGSSDTLMATGATSYSWSSGGNTSMEIVMPSTTSSYTVTGTDANGCANTDVVSVTVNPLPVVNLGADVAQCGGSVVFDAQNAGANYLWNSGNTLQTETVSITGPVMVTVTDANGCVNMDSVNVAINSNPVVNLGADVEQCGGVVTLDAQNQGATYMWSNTFTTQIISVSATGTYYVDVTDANGCMGSDTAMVTIHPDPTVTGTPSSTSPCLSDAAVTLTGSPAGGTWSGTGVTGSSFSPATAGVGPETVTYNYTDANGCSASASSVITVNACVGVAEQNSENGMSVFPNPNNGTFTIAVETTVGDLVIVITDMQGRVVYSSVENNVQSGFTKQISLEKESAGLYLMHISANGEQRMEKIAVQK